MFKPFRDKEIVLGVTGSIAAYKSCDIASRLVEAGACVRPVLSENAAHFIGKASLEGITGNPVVTGLFEPLPHPEIEHIALSRRAALFLIAPATANIIAKAAQGIADNWLTTALLATRAPVLFAPAMNMYMYDHPATQANIALLTERGAYFVGPGSGQLACGDIGPGRLIETQSILDVAAQLLTQHKDFLGKRVLITCGANQEPIDPVRYLGNRSSGKMGAALAHVAQCRGADVTVISGTMEVPLPHGVQIEHANTAMAMLEAVEAHKNQTDVFIFAAAVADYHAATLLKKKHKREAVNWSLEFTPNPDIAASIGLNKSPGQIAVGFAAESSDILAQAKNKLERKKMDLVLANEISGENNAIGAEEARTWLLHENGQVDELPKMSKPDIAWKVLDAVAALGNFADNYNHDVHPS